MRNIETKFYSQGLYERSIKRIFVVYIAFAVLRIILFSTLGISVSNSISFGDTFFFYQDYAALFKLFFLGFVFLLLFIASVVLLASCLNIVADLDDSHDLKKRLYFYLIPMLLDIFAGLSLAGIVVINKAASFLGIILSLVEIGLLIWLKVSANKDAQNTTR
nr:hypothetical protein [uncultured Mogibacterium sp.]